MGIQGRGGGGPPPTNWTSWLQSGGGGRPPGRGNERRLTGNPPLTMLQKIMLCAVFLFLLIAFASQSRQGYDWYRDCIQPSSRSSSTVSSSLTSQSNPCLDGIFIWAGLVLLTLMQNIFSLFGIYYREDENWTYPYRRDVFYIACLAFVLYLMFMAGFLSRIGLHLDLSSLFISAVATFIFVYVAFWDLDYSPPGPSPYQAAANALRQIREIDGDHGVHRVVQALVAMGGDRQQETETQTDDPSGDGDEPPPLESDSDDE